MFSFIAGQENLFTKFLFTKFTRIGVSCCYILCDCVILSTHAHFHMYPTVKFCTDFSRNCPHACGDPEITKESKSIEKSLKLNDIIEQKISKFFISHVRKSSGTEIKYVNTHPFGYKNWIFAHKII